MSNGINRNFFVIDIYMRTPREINDCLSEYSGLINVTPIGNRMLLIEKVPDKVQVKAPSSLSAGLGMNIGGRLDARL